MTAYLTRTEKQLELLKMMGLKEIRALPLSVLTSMPSFLREEKLVRIDGKVVINSFLPPFPSEAFRTLAKGVQSLVGGRAVPVSTYFSVTNRCTFNCWHCSKKHRGPGELSLETVIRAVGELQDLGVSIIGFTGGEPLLRTDLERIVRSMDERSVSLLFTSGDGLTAERAKALKRSGLFGIAVSLDHFDPEVHDKRRGRKGAFEMAVDAVRVSRENNFYTIIQCVATRDIMEDGTMEKYLDMARALGVYEIRLLEPVPTGRLLDGDQSCCLTEHERQKLRALHKKTNRAGNRAKVCAFAHVEHKDMYGCGAGFQHMYIDAEGNMCPCDFVPISFGNVRTESVKTLWRRMNGVFSRPRPCCFMMENADKLRKAFNGTLPIPYEAVKDRCEFSHGRELPAYYRKLGWC